MLWRECAQRNADFQTAPARGLKMKYRPYDALFGAPAHHPALPTDHRPIDSLTSKLVLLKITASFFHVDLLGVSRHGSHCVCVRLPCGASCRMFG